MKKQFTLLTLLLLMMGASFGQTITQTNTQFPNPGFEAYREHSSASVNTGTNAKWVPFNWHTFDEANATIWGSNTARKTHHNYQTSGGKSGAYFEMICKEVLTIPANGALSCGRTKIGSMSAGSSDNYNYTDVSNNSSYSTSGKYSWQFVGCPDSMSFYYRTQISNSSHKPLFKVFLHGDGEFRDRADGSLYGSSSSPLIGCSVDTFERYQSTTNWKREVKAFMYTTPGQGGSSYTFQGQAAPLNSYGYYSSLNRPTYMLASFSTEKKAGTGTDGDKLAVDELWCIYDKGLKTLTVNGTNQSSILSAFNAAEFLTHEPTRTYNSTGSSGVGNPSFNNSGSNSQDYSGAITFNSADVSAISATPKSKLITNFVITQPSLFYKTTNPQGAVGAIKVTHNDNSTFTYTVNFTNAKPAQPTTSNVSRCGAGTVNLTATIPSGLVSPTVPSDFSNYAVTCKWYTAASGGTAVETGTSYSPNVTSTRTYYVSTYITYDYSNGNRTYSRNIESDRKAVTVTVNSAPTVSLASNANQTVCSGTAINAINVTSTNGTLSVTGLPAGVSLSGASISGTPTATGAHNYTVSCASSGCPTATATGTITVNALPIVSIAGNTSFCQNSNTTLTASGTGTSYAWSNGTATADNTVSAAGTYTVTATLNGCTATASQAVTQKPLPTVSISGNTSFCENDNTTLTASGTGASYAWSNGANTAANTVSAAGNYTVTATLNGCTATASQAVTQKPLPTVSISGNTSFCENSNTTLTASGTGASYAWSNGANTAANTVSAAGTYTVTATLNGCTATTSQAVTTNPTYAQTESLIIGTADLPYTWRGHVIPVGTTSGPIVYNETSVKGCDSVVTLNLTVNASMFTLTINYKYTDGTTAHASHTESVAYGAPYSVTSPTISGYAADQTVVSGTMPAHDVTVNVEYAATNRQLTIHYVYATGGTAAADHSEAVQVGNTYSVTSPSLTGYTPDQTVVSGTMGTENVTVTVTYTQLAPEVAAITAPGAICAGGALTLTAPSTQYADDEGWQMAANNTFANAVAYNGQTLNASHDGWYLRYFATNDANTTYSNVVTLTVNALPTVSISGETAFCDGESTTLTATSGASYAWSNGESTRAIEVDEDDTYTVTVTDANGCSNRASVDVTMNALPTVSISGTTAFCAGGNTTLTATSGASYAWSNGESTRAIEVDEDDTYTVTVTDANGCSNSASVDVTMNALPTVSISGNTAFCAGSNTTLTATSGASYTWSNNATTQSIEVAAGGSYTVTVTDANNCSNSASVNVTMNALPVVSISGTTAFCAGSNTTLTATSGASYAWSNNAITQEITVTAGGSYSVTVTDANNCSNSASVTVTMNALPVVSISGTTAFCAGDNTTLTAASGASYAWSNNATTQEITVTAGGSYSVTVTDANNCSNSASVNVTVNALPTVSISGTTAFCAGDNTTLTATSGASYAWSNNATTQSIEVAAGGNYTVTVTDANNCSNSASVTVTVNALPEVSISGTTAFCAGSNTTLTATSGASYAWSNNATTQSIEVAAGGRYTVTVTDANNCSNSASVNVTMNALPEVSISGNTAFCAGSNTTLTATSGASYVWSNNATTQEITVTEGGSYSVTVTDANNCSNSASVNVTMNALPEVSISGTTAFCAGGNTTLTATSGASYAWSNNATTQEITVTEGGRYTVTVTDANNCSNSASVNVTVNALPEVSISGTTAFCAGSNTTLTATSGASYAWSNNATTQSLEVAAGGSYTVTVTDANNCSNSASVTVTVNALPVVTIDGNTSFCAGESTSLTASEGVSYAWSNRETSRRITVTTGGEYTVSVSDGNGCVGTARVEVFEDELPAAPVCNATNNSSCAAPNGMITITAPTGSGYQYSLNGSNFQTGTTYSGLNAGNYAVTVRNAQGCTASSSVMVGNDGNNVDAQASATSPCVGGTIALTATSQTSGVSYSWSGPNGFTSNTQNPNITNASSANAGVYTLTVKETATNCTMSATVNVTVHALPNVTISGENTICQGATTTLTANGATSYTWTSPVSQDATIQVNHAGTYSVVGTDANGCENDATITVVENIPSVTLNDIANVDICEGAAIAMNATLNASSGFVTYTWTGPNNYTSNNQNVAITAATTNRTGSYVVTATATKVLNGVSCTATDSKTVEVTVNALPAITITGDQTICAGTSTTLTAAGATQYAWNNGSTSATTQVNQAGNYSVTGTDANGCTNNASFSVEVNTPAVALNEITGTTTLCAGENLTLTASLAGTPAGDVTYRWNNQMEGATLNVASVQTSGTYTVTATAAKTMNGVTCEATDTKSVDVTVNALPATLVTNVTNNTSCATPNGVIAVTTPVGTAYNYRLSTSSAAQTSPRFEGLNAGTYNIIVTDVNTGCQRQGEAEVVTIGSNLNVTAESVVICQGETAQLQASSNVADVTYAWSGPNGFTSTVQNPTIANVVPANAGTYNLTVTETATHCTSTANASVTVNVPQHTALTEVACGSFTWNNTRYTQSGKYTYSHEDANGCTQVDTLHLTINNPTHTATTIAACDEYVWNGTTYTQSGKYTYSHTDANGCTQVDTLHLTINQTPVVSISGNLNIVEGNSTVLTASGADSYVWSTDETTVAITVAPMQTTVYSVVGTSNGCTSNPAEVSVNVSECVVATKTIVAEACGSYTWYGEEYTASTTTATHTVEGVAADGCDSVYTLHLTIWNADATEFEATECGSYTWINDIYTRSGDYEKTFANIHGCDSVVTLHLTINNPTHTATTIVACDEYVWNGTTYTQSGKYTYSHTDANGCTQVDTLHLTINQTPVVSISGNLNIVEGNSTTLTASGADSYVWSTDETTAAITVAPMETTVYSVVGTSNGCTSNPAEVSVNVSECVVATKTIVAEACGSYTWYGEEYTASTTTATHTVEGVAADGCDSLYTLHLTIWNADATEFEATECGSYTWINDIYTRSGDYEKTFANIHGCDSVVTLHLTINNPTHNATTIAACDEYEWNGTTYTQSGKYTYSHTDANGCTQVDTLHLTINQTPVVSISGNLDIVEGNSTTLTASGADSYVWSTDETTAAITVAPMQTTVYSVVGTSNGCTSNPAEVSVNVSECVVATKTIVAEACGSYTWYGEEYTASTTTATHTVEGVAADGCDSLYTLHLTIWNADATEFEATECGSYTWINDIYTRSGDYEKTFANIHGCDSVVTLHLTINNPTHVATTIVACDEYEWNGTTYTQSGKYTYSHTDANGCTQVDTLHLTINQTPVVSISGNLDIVEGNSTTLTASGADSYVWSTDETTAAITVAPMQTTVYSVVGTSNGCSSNPAEVSVNVSECVVATKTIVAEACGSYTWYGEEYTASTTTATHTVEGVAADGCDSLYTLHLTIWNADATEFEATECGSYTWINDIYTRSGDYEKTFANIHGCDSVVTLHLTINNPTHNATTIAACDEYEWNGTTYTQSGNYTYSHTDANGCTQVDTLHLTINQTPVVSISGNLDIVEGNSTTLTASGADSYVWSTDETTAAITVAPMQTTVYSVVGTSNGCSSNPAEVSVNVSECVVATKTIVAEACGSYTWYGEEYTASTTTATHTVEGVAADGCDSLYTLHLTIWNADATEFEATECGSYTWINDIYTRSGDYVKTFANIHGCDSVVTLHLTINNPTHAATTIAACDEYEWNGQTYTQSGNYTYSHIDNNGCTQVDTLHLTINQTPEVRISGNLNIVEGNSTVLTASGADSYVWSTDETTAAITVAPMQTTVYSVVGTSNGCTSNPAEVSVNVSECVVATKTIVAEACGSYTWYGEEYTASTTTATHTVEGVAAFGCDSVYTLHLTIWNADATEFEETACGSYTWINDIYTRSGDYEKTFANIHGCDSVVTLHLTINNPTHAAVTEVACGSFTWNNTEYRQSGNYTFAHEDANGCTQVDTLHLTINNPVHTAVTEVACGSFTWNNTEYTQSGNYTYSHEDANGCTQVDTLHLTINNPVHEAFEQDACGSYVWNGTTYTQTGVYTYAHEDANGCEQVDTLHLTIRTADYYETTQVACESYTWDGTVYTESGDYVKTYTNQMGCDSVMTLHLTINNPVHEAVTEVACGSFTWNNTEYTQSGNYTYAHEDANGCTQVDTLHLTIKPVATNYILATICAGSTYMQNGFNVNTAGEHTLTLTAANGCDSVVTLLLSLDYNCAFTCGDVMYDVDNNAYGTREYNGRCWMTENLRTEHYADGLPVSTAMIYNGVNANTDTNANLETYGRLYDMQSTFRGATPVDGIQGICPNGWHVPSAAEYQALVNAYAPVALRSANYWLINPGNNASAFDLRPGGFYNGVNTRCENLGGEAYFYTSTMQSGMPVHLKAACGCWEIMFNTATPANAFSVRCVHDSTL